MGIFDFLKNTLHQRTDFQVLNGIHLPDGQSFATKFSNFFDLNLNTNIDVISTLAPVGKMDKFVLYVKDEFLDKTREETKDKWAKLQQIALNEIIKVDVNDPPPCPGYLWFGNKDCVKNLELLCKENPFFAAALTVFSSHSEDFLELKSFATSGETLDSKYAALMSKMLDSRRFINVRFNTKMEVVEMTYKGEDGKAVRAKPEEWDFYASGVIYNLVYFSSCIHATIHVFHYMMTSAINEATKFDKSLHTWAMPYDDNIAVKYLEVGVALIKPTVGDTLKKISLLDRDPDVYTVTGSKGFGAETGSNVDLCKEMCVTWGHCNSVDDFMEGFLLSDLYKSPHGKKVAQEADLLSEFNKQAALVKPYAEELSAAMKDADKAAFEKAEKNLKEYLSNCGEGVCAIDNISSWVQLMSITGIVHGSTISYTRATLMEEIMRWRNLDGKTWDEPDLNLFKSISTVQGMEVGRHVFTDDLHTKNINAKVSAVMKKYDDMSLALKEKSKEKIRAMPEFREYGWILSDWCPDGFDGKQLTIATYI